MSMRDPLLGPLVLGSETKCERLEVDNLGRFASALLKEHGHGSVGFGLSSDS